MDYSGARRRGRTAMVSEAAGQRLSLGQTRRIRKPNGEKSVGGISRAGVLNRRKHLARENRKVVTQLAYARAGHHHARDGIYHRDSRKHGPRENRGDGGMTSFITELEKQHAGSTQLGKSLTRLPFSAASRNVFPRKSPPLNSSAAKWPRDYAIIPLNINHPELEPMITRSQFWCSDLREHRQQRGGIEH